MRKTSHLIFCPGHAVPRTNTLQKGDEACLRTGERWISVSIRQDAAGAAAGAAAAWDEPASSRPWRRPQRRGQGDATP